MNAITYEELLAEFEKFAATTGDGWLTAAELAEKTGQGAYWIRNKLRQLHTDGRLEVSRKYITNIAGARNLSPCYRLKPKKKK